MGRYFVRIYPLGPRSARHYLCRIERVDPLGEPRVVGSARSQRVVEAILEARRDARANRERETSCDVQDIAF